MKQAHFKILIAFFALALLYPTNIFATEDVSSFDLESDEDEIVIETIILTLETPDEPENIELETEPSDGEEEGETEKSSEENNEEGDETDVVIEVTASNPGISSASTETIPLPIYPTTTINLQIETFDTTLYNDALVVTACPNTENGIEYTHNIWCAIEQLSEQKGWIVADTWGAYGVTYDINEYKGNDFSDGMWWGWYSELSPGMTGVNAHTLSENENILLVYGVEPAKITVENSTPEVNTTTTIEFQKFDWGTFGWIPNTSSTFVINNEEYFDTDGIYELEITTTTPYEIYATKTGFLNSEIVIITPTSTPDENNEEENTDNSGNGGGTVTLPTDEFNVVSQVEIDDAINKILEYLKSQQDVVTGGIITGHDEITDKPIVDGNMTDWAIMSFGADEQYADDIKQNNGKSLLDYEKSYDLDATSDVSDCATYARHTLALLSAGIEKTDDSIVGLQDKMHNMCYLENSINPGTYGIAGTNDDIFALLALLSIEDSIDQEIITYLIDKLQSTQDTTNGGFSMGWGVSPDATGASINALKNAQSKGVELDENIFTTAKEYLKDNQFEDGSWGYLHWETSEPISDIITTSWVLMGLNALGDSQDDWTNENGYTPFHLLVSNLNQDGYYETQDWQTGETVVDWFSMKHAVPALAGASWPIVLDPIVEDFSDGATFTYGSGGGGTHTPPVEEITTPTTTVDIVTSTLDMVTTTEQIVTTTTDIVEVPEEDEETPTQIDETYESPSPAPAAHNTPQPSIRGEKIEKKHETNIGDEIKIESDKQKIEKDPSPAETTADEEKNSPIPLVTLIITGGTVLIYGAWRLIKILI